MYNVRMKTQSYKDLVVWQKGITLAKVVYRLTQNLPPGEKFGLVAQMRRSAVSIHRTLQRVRHATPPANSSSSFLTLRDL
jgi:hypothetical protein